MGNNDADGAEREAPAAPAPAEDSTDWKAIADSCNWTKEQLADATSGDAWRKILDVWRVAVERADKWRANEAAANGRETVAYPPVYVETTGLLMDALTTAILARPRPAPREVLRDLWTLLQSALECEQLQGEVVVFRIKLHRKQSKVSFDDVWGSEYGDEEEEDEHDEGEGDEGEEGEEDEGEEDDDEDEDEDEDDEYDEDEDAEEEEEEEERVLSYKMFGDSDEDDEDADEYAFRDDYDSDDIDEFTDDIDASAGFQAASAKDTYGSSSIWVNGDLNRLQINANEIEISSNVSGSQGNGSVVVETGTYRGEAVALKRLTGAAKTLEDAAALASIGIAFSSLSHANIVSLIGVAWEKAQDLQIVTSMAEKGDLRSFLDSSDAESLTWSDFKCQVAIDVASALAYLHQQNLSAGLGIVNSRHVLLDKEDAAKLDVFQLPYRDIDAARDREPSPLRWIAPEVILSGPSTSAADVYSFGVILTELDTLKLPFHDAVNPNGVAMEDALIAMHVSKGELRPSLSDECPEEIEALVTKCLCQDPEKRPHAEQLEYQLRALVKEL